MECVEPSSPRLSYERLTARELARFHSLARDPYVRRYLLDGAQMEMPWSEQVLAAAEREWVRTGLGLWLLRERGAAQAEPLGFAGFQRFAGEHAPPQLLYAVREPFTGRGLAREAVQALIDFARERSGLGDIDAEVDEHNERSRRLLERLGFALVHTSDAGAGKRLQFRLPVGRPPRELRGARLRLRPFEPRDREPFAALNADPEVMALFPAPLSRAESDALAARIEQRFAQHGFGLWAVELIDSATFVGFTGLSFPSFEAHFTPCVEIGWRLAAAHWGRGYAGEAATLALRAGFVHLRLAQVVSFTSCHNLRSRRVMERLGMSHDPRDDFDHPRIAQGHPLQRHVLYRLDAPAKLAR